jgi:hypothetical protein
MRANIREEMIGRRPFSTTSAVINSDFIIRLIINTVSLIICGGA